MTPARIALLIDADSIAADRYEAIAAASAKLGEVVICRVYGDFSNKRLHDWLQLCLAHGLEPVMQLTAGKGRNSTDIALTIASMDLMAQGHVDAIGIASNDGDFVPLAQRLKAGGIAVHGFGNAQASKALRAICTSYAVVEARRAAEPSPFPFPTASNLAPMTAPRGSVPAFGTPPILDAVRRIMAESGPDRTMTLSAVGAALRKHAPSLSETVAGKGKLRKTLMATGRFEEFGNGTDIRIRMKSA